MKSHRFKRVLLITIGILAISLIFLAGGCTKADYFIPEAIQLERGPIMITADQLYQEYMADEAAADAKYKGRDVWFLEARVGSYLESENGSYLEMLWFSPSDIIEDPMLDEPIEIENTHLVEGAKEGKPWAPGYCLCAVKLEPQLSEGFSDVGGGYIVETVGECLGLSNGVVTIKIKSIAMSGEALPPPPPDAW